MTTQTSAYAPAIEALPENECVEFSKHGEGGRFLNATDINTIRCLVQRLNARDPLSQSKFCVRTMPDLGAVQVYRMPKFAEEYVHAIRDARAKVTK